MKALKRNFRSGANKASDVTCLDEYGNESNIQQELNVLNSNTSSDIRFNQSTGIIEIFYEGVWNKLESVSL